LIESLKLASHVANIENIEDILADLDKALRISQRRRADSGCGARPATPRR
jgi:hypothetical protein